MRTYNITYLVCRYSVLSLVWCVGCGYGCVCVCVCERERERERVCVRENGGIIDSERYVQVQVAQHKLFLFRELWSRTFSGQVPFQFPFPREKFLWGGGTT